MGFSPKFGGKEIRHCTLSTIFAIMWENHIKDFRNYLKLERSLSANSVEAYVRDVEKLKEFIEAKHKDLEVTKVSPKILQEFLEEITRSGISAHSQARLLSGLKGFFR